MGCFTVILYFMFLPIIICFYACKIGFLLFWEFIKLIISILGGYNFKSDNYSSKKTAHSNNNKRKKNTSYKDMEFDEQANLWGLSEEDKRIAKEERMSPADFIEAEERDDDELTTDEWE